MSPEARRIGARLCRGVADLIDNEKVGAVGILILATDGPCLYVPAELEEAFAKAIEDFDGIDIQGVQHPSDLG